jgi:HD-GYP domain-containing protein (c-di-GMP phosphodiesterase class II)
VRIFSAVDIWDALVSDRPYHAPWTKEKVREHLRLLSGTQLDPKIVDVFLRMEIKGELEDPGHHAVAV